jgi:hypothetical protein
MASPRNDPPHGNDVGNEGDAPIAPDLVSVVSTLAPGVTDKYQKEHIALQKETNRLQHEKDLRQSDLGTLGRFFGVNALLFVAGILAVCIIVLMGLSFLLDVERFRVILPLLASVLASIVGYMFGKGTKKKGT